jgi:hypothetical protein
MKKEYILKHKNKEVLYFEMNNEDYEVMGINKIIDEQRLPYYVEDKKNIVEYAIRLNTWIKSRGLSGSRKDIHNIRKLFKTDNMSKLIVDSYGLNLTDHYWLHKTENAINWESVNYFDNDFDQLKQSGNYSPVIDNSVKNPSPNFCVDGSIEKRWVIANGERILLKGSRYKCMQEPFNEQIASKIMDEFEINHVHYDQKKTKDMIPYSECKTMSDKNNEFINAQWVLNSKSDENKPLYEHYIDVCKEHKITDAKENIDAMIAIDFFIGNEDRHRGNFGILRNADTLDWVKIAPIFDNGNSLFYDKENESYDDWGIDTLGKAFGDSNRLQLTLIGYPEWYNNTKGNLMIEIIVDELKHDERLSEKKIERIAKVVLQRKSIFENMIEKMKSM